MSNDAENKNLTIKKENVPYGINNLPPEYKEIEKALEGINIHDSMQRLLTIAAFGKTEKTLIEQMEAVNNAISILLQRSLEQEKSEGTESYINSLSKLHRTFLKQIEALETLQEKRRPYLIR